MIQTLTLSPTIAAPPTQSLEYRQQEEDRRPERSIVLDPGHGIPWPWSCDPSNGGLIGARNTSSLNSGPWLRFQRPNLDLDHVSTFLTRCCGVSSTSHPNWIIWMDPNFTRIGLFGWIQISSNFTPDDVFNLSHDMDQVDQAECLQSGAIHGSYSQGP